jgi:hypothetical protein
MPTSRSLPRSCCLSVCWQHLSLLVLMPFYNAILLVGTAFGKYAYVKVLAHCVRTDAEAFPALFAILLCHWCVHLLLLHVVRLLDSKDVLPPSPPSPALWFPGLLSALAFRASTM